MNVNNFLKDRLDKVLKQIDKIETNLKLKSKDDKEKKNKK